MREATATPGGRALGSLPGPRPWPLLGNMAQLDVPRMHAQLEAWAREYGPLYRVRFGRRDALVVARSDLIAAMLRDRPDGWSRMRAMEAIIGEMGAAGVFSAEGDDWRRQRRLVMAAFDPGHLKRYFSSLVRVTERLRERLERAARNDEWVDLQTVLMRYTVDVTTGLAFGVDLDTQNADHPLQDHLDKVFPMLMRRINAPFPWWRHVRLPSDRAFDRHRAEIHKAVQGFVQAARARMAREPRLREQPANLLEAMIAARDDQGAGLSEQDVIGNVLTILLAGEDTTANSLAWLLYLLHAHRETWNAVVATVEAALGADEMPWFFEAARDLDVIERCANEAMRLRPVAPLLFIECNRDTLQGGVFLPSGSLVVCLMRFDSVDTRLAADAAEFRPERWREPANLLKASMPFGAGPRLCPGRYLAMLEMKMVVAMLARNFELIEVRCENGAPPAERLAFTMFPVGLKMKLGPRRRIH